MINKKKIMESLSNAEDKYWVSNILDKVVKSQKNRSVEYTNFLDPYQQAVIKKLFIKAGFKDFMLDGGYPEAERKLLAVHADLNTADPGPESSEYIEVPVKRILIPLPKFSDLSHRDFLGALLGLGIEREKIGDIILSEQNCLIMAIEDISDYILYQLERIGKFRISARIAAFEEVVIKEKEMKTIRTTVPSLRLDCILAAGLNLSRSDAWALLKSGRISVNWEPAENKDRPLKEGDVLSIKGKGRLVFTGVGNVTKKGRIQVTLERPL